MFHEMHGRNLLGRIKKKERTKYKEGREVLAPGTEGVDTRNALRYGAR
jgi:hypothetical protein